MAKDCIEILKSSSEALHKYLEEKAGLYDGSSKSKEAWRKASTELQHETLNHLNNIYAEVQLPGYKKITKEKPSSSTNEESLLNELRNNSNDVEKQQDLQYFIDKASEDPAGFMEIHGKKITNELLKEKATVEQLKEKRDYLVENFGESETTDYLNDIIVNREKAQPKEEPIESKKADIEKRRQQELSANKKFSELNKEVGSESEMTDEINKKYDAELSKFEKQNTQDTKQAGQEVNANAEVDKVKQPAEGTKEKIRVTAQQLKALQPKQQKDFLSKMRSLADKIESDGIRAALPDWAKADLPEGTQQQGFGGKSLDQAVAKAIRLVVDGIEKGKLLAEAIEDGFTHLKSYYTKNTKKFDANKLRDDFSNSMNDLLAQMKPDKPRIRVIVPTISGSEYEKRKQQNTGDPIDNFSIIYGSDKIIQDVIGTHEKRDENYVANPTDYERNQIALKSMSYEMDKIVGDVLGQNSIQDSVDYFVEKLKNKDLALWIRNLLTVSLQRSLRGRPDILNNIRTSLDVGQATESSLSMLSRQDWLAERGLSSKQQDDIVNSVDGGDDIIANKNKAQEAFESNEIDEKTEVEVASRTAEDIKADMEALKKKKPESKKSKKETIDKDAYLAKAAAAENRILMSGEGKSKKQILDRIKEIIAKC